MFFQSATEMRFSEPSRAGSIARSRMIFLVLRGRGPSHRAVGSRLVEEVPQSAVALVAAEDENVGRASSRPVKGFLAKEVEVGEIPGETAGELELVKNPVARLEKIGA
jgi:hypothetical protein